MMRVLTWMAEHWAVILLGVLVCVIALGVLFAWWISTGNDDEHGDW